MLDATSNTPYDNAKEALRTIAGKVSFYYDYYDDSWNTRTLGRRLMEHIQTNISVDDDNDGTAALCPHKDERTMRKAIIWLVMTLLAGGTMAVVAMTVQ